MQVCPRCNEPIPADELSEHMRIELIDPKWKEQKQRFLEKQKTTNLIDKGNVIADNLKRLAEFRADIFGGDVMEAERKIREKQAEAIEKQRVIWDGHSASIQNVTAKAAMTLEEQIAVLNATLDAKEASAIGPRLPGQPSSAATSIQPVSSMTHVQVSAHSFFCGQVMNLTFVCCGMISLNSLHLCLLIRIPLFHPLNDQVSTDLPNRIDPRLESIRIDLECMGSENSSQIRHTLPP